jgi:hypothetical protein
MNTTRLLMVAAIVLLFASCTSGPYKSNNWEVVVHKVRYETNFGFAPKKYNGFVIDVSVKYIGPDSEVIAPAIYLKKGSGEELRADLVQTQKSDPASDLIIRAWLGDKETKFKMKTGDTLSKAPLSLLWALPKKPGQFKLMIGDVPPIDIYF